MPPPGPALPHANPYGQPPAGQPYGYPVDQPTAPPGAHSVLPPPPPPGHPGYAGYPAAPMTVALPAPSQFGTNGFAIAALICGIVGLIPFVGVAAVVLGIVALRQIPRRLQTGKGMAITGIVLGTLFSLLVVPAFIAAVGDGIDDARRSDAVRSSRPTTTADDGRIRVDRLVDGQCFDGAREGVMVSVTAKPCTGPHESQVVVSFELPVGDWPGEDLVIKDAEDGCLDRMSTVVKDKYLDLSMLYLYPNSRLAWNDDRKVVCVIDDPKGKLTESVLK